MENEYYLGLDIGTDSVGYAVTDTTYKLKKFKGEPMWGATLFDAANGSEGRRGFRTGRRRLDRRQQRVKLLEDIFAEEIVKIDPAFFIRRKESALYPEDSSCGVHIFEGGDISDAEYHKKYPTIHHLINDLMKSHTKHDIRLVYIACAWLVANRGHFLFDMPVERTSELLDFDDVYRDFQDYMNEQGYSVPWNTEIAAHEICCILQKECGIREKTDLLKSALFNGRKPEKEPTESFPFSADAVLSLLAGGKVKPKDIFCDSAYEELESISLNMSEDDYSHAMAELGDDCEILNHLRALSNCALMLSVMKGDQSISAGKVAVYDQHKEDLKYLKRFVKRYCPEKYNEIFRDVVKKDKDGRGNYLSYSHNTKSLKKCASVEFVNKEGFCKFLESKLKGIKVDEADQSAYDDMMRRIEARSFLPKQKDGDNRVIPQQLYRMELARILDCAQEYTPLLCETDENGLSVHDKILSIFDFRIPYYVGPLRSDGENAWMVRKEEGKILPWNFTDKVDLDQSEQKFIARMTNRCTYLKGENVLPEHSLLYEKFKVLNELNNLKINGIKIEPKLKQEIYTEVFEKNIRVSVKKIENYLRQHCYVEKNDIISGLDLTVRSNLKSYHVFRRLIHSGSLNEMDVENIIEHMAYTEDKSRLRRWLKNGYSDLDGDDIEYILRQNLKGFGRLSKRLLTGIEGTEKESDGEVHTIMDYLWNSNENLMQLLSDRYTFAEIILDENEEYYHHSRMSLDKRLSEMYVSNAVKRQIYRTLDVVRDIEKAMGCAPSKIFVEMARGGKPEQRGKRTASRKEQLLAIYKRIKTEDSRRFTEELGKMGAMVDNRLQDRRLFLYYLQMGKCAYSGSEIDLAHLSDGTYNLDHIYPQCFVKDDSLLNNLVLVDSKINGTRKQDIYPVPADIRHKMIGFWRSLKENGLMTEEKYHRLTRISAFTDEEKMSFINRQLVETRQSTKVITGLLQEHFENAQIVYVKAGMVSEFRQEFNMLKCRTVNDLHHAKDAYLNIVVGNVYDERFTKQWFSLKDSYNVQVKKIFKQRHAHGEICYWRGGQDLELVRHVMSKNAAHVTRYPFCRRGGMFDQQPVKKKVGLVPLKAGLSTERYGGYNKPTASFYVLARFEHKKDHEVMFVPVNLMDSDRFIKDRRYARQRTAEIIKEISKKQPQEVELLLNERLLKINTVITVDGVPMTLSGKMNGGQSIIFSPLTVLVLGKTMEDYVKAIEVFQNKRKINRNILPDEQHDGLSAEKNLQLFDLLVKKLQGFPYCKIPGNPEKLVSSNEARNKFISSDIVDQMACLLGLLQLMGGKTNNCDLSIVGGPKTSGNVVRSSKLSNWTKYYQDVRIVDTSASGLFSHSSTNLLNLL